MKECLCGKNPFIIFAFIIMYINFNVLLLSWDIYRLLSIKNKCIIEFVLASFFLERVLFFEILFLWKTHVACRVSVLLMLLCNKWLSFCIEVLCSNSLQCMYIFYYYSFYVLFFIYRAAWNKIIISLMYFARIP